MTEEAPYFKFNTKDDKPFQAQNILGPVHSMRKAKVVNNEPLYHVHDGALCSLNHQLEEQLEEWLLAVTAQQPPLRVLVVQLEAAGKRPAHPPGRRAASPPSRSNGQYQE